MRAIEELGMDIICGYCTPGLQVLLLLFYRDQGGSIQAQVLHIRSQVFSGMWKGGLSEVCRVFFLQGLSVIYESSMMKGHSAINDDHAVTRHCLRLAASGTRMRLSSHIHLDSIGSFEF